MCYFETIIYYEYNIKSILKAIMKKFLHHLCDFLCLSTNLLHLGPKGRKKTKRIRKNGGTVIASAGGIGSLAKYKDNFHENERSRV